MREKILAALLLKFAGMSKEALGLLADLGVKKVTEEDKIEGFVSELENSPIPVKDFVDFLQKEGDKRVSTAKAKWEAENKKPIEKPIDKQVENPEDPNQKILNELLQKVNNLEKEKTLTSLKDKLNKALEAKKLPAFLAEGRLIEKEEDIESLVTDIESKFTAFQQEQINQGLITVSKPAGGDPKGTKEASKEEVSAIVNEIM